MPFALAWVQWRQEVPWLWVLSGDALAQVREPQGSLESEPGLV